MMHHPSIMRAVEIQADANVVPFARQPILEPTGAEIVREGNRNNALFPLCLRKANQCDNISQLWQYAMDANQRYCSPPLGGAEISSLVASAWQYTEQGINTWRCARSTRIGR